MTRFQSFFGGLRREKFSAPVLGTSDAIAWARQRGAVHGDTVIDNRGGGGETIYDDIPTQFPDLPTLSAEIFMYRQLPRHEWAIYDPIGVPINLAILNEWNFYVTCRQALAIVNEAAQEVIFFIDTTPARRRSPAERFVAGNWFGF